MVLLDSKRYIVICVEQNHLHDKNQSQSSLSVFQLALQEGSGRVFIVPNVTSAIDILSLVVQTLTPARRDLKKQFHDSVKAKNFVGDSPSKAAAMHVTTAFRNWANRFELPVGESDVLMSRFGTISGIGTADLSAAPLYDRTKDKLHSFFGSHGDIAQLSNQQQVANVPMGTTQPYSTSTMYQQGGIPTGMFQQHYQSSSEYQTPPRDSVMGMVPPENDMGFSDFAGEWQDNVKATPQFLSQQFVPRRMQMMDNQVQSHHNDGSRRLLSQFNHPMGNAIRPFSSYSAADDSRAEHVPGYYR